MGNEKLFTKIVVVFFSSCFLSSLSWAAPAAVTEWEVRDLSGLKLEIFKRPPFDKDKIPKPPEKPGPDFPPDLTVSPAINPKRNTILQWTPSGVNNYPASPKCRQESLRDRIWKNTSPAAQGLAVNDWLSQCQSELGSPFAKHSYIPLIKYSTVSYDFLDIQNIRAVKETLLDGRVLTGFIAMQQGCKPRRFVSA